MVHNQLGQTFGMAFMDLATGEELALKAPEFPISHEYGTTVPQGIAQVQFDTLGAYSATVAGQIPGGDKLMVRRFDMVALIKGLVWGFVLIFLGFIAGPVMALVVLVKRQNYKRIHRNEPIGEKESSMFVPLGNFIAPIVIWQIKKHESDFVVEQAKESLNFQITLILYFIISIPLCFIIIGFFLIFALVIFGLIMVIVGGIRANEGDDFCYPMTLRLIK
jgi:uncharacterized Tic20 family protein